jgi:hypothetical protein
MIPGKRSTQIASLRKKQLEDKVLRILQQNKQGLTSLEIAVLADPRMPRNVLLELQKDGLIKRRKGLSGNGRISVLYVLNEDKAQKTSSLPQ